jgi:hypothetical protein
MNIQAPTNFGAPNISQMLQSGIGDLPAAYYAGAQERYKLTQQAPLTDENGQPIDPTSNPNAAYRAIMRRMMQGGAPTAQGLMPYLWGGAGGAQGGETLPAVPPEAGGSAAVAAPGPAARAQPAPGQAVTTVASLAKAYAGPEFGGRDATRAAAQVAQEMSTDQAKIDPAQTKLNPDQVEEASMRLLNIMRGRQATASPIATPAAMEGETAGGPQTAAEARIAPPEQQATAGAPAPVTSPGAAEVAMPATGVQPRAAPVAMVGGPAVNNPAGVGVNNIITRPSPMQAYAQATPAEVGAGGRPTTPPAEISPQRAMEISGIFRKRAEILQRQAERLALVPGGVGAGRAAQLAREAQQNMSSANAFQQFALQQMSHSETAREAQRLGFGNDVPAYEAHKAALAEHLKGIAAQQNAVMNVGLDPKTDPKGRIDVLDNIEDAVKEAVRRGAKWGEAAPVIQRIQSLANSLFPGNPPFDPARVGAVDLVQKLNQRLVALMGREGTLARSEREFTSFLSSNPDMKGSPQGTLMLIDLMRQAEMRKMKLAYTAGNTMPENWMKVQQQFNDDERNDIVGPWRRHQYNRNTGQVFVYPRSGKGEPYAHPYKRPYTSEE